MNELERERDGSRDRLIAYYEFHSYMRINGFQGNKISGIMVMENGYFSKMSNELAISL